MAGRVGVQRPEVGLTQAEKDQLARSHRQLVYLWCRRFYAKAPPCMSRDEVEAYGWRGLAHALEKYDPTKGVTFGAFAGPWVRGAILRGIEHEIQAAPSLNQFPPKPDKDGVSQEESIPMREFPQGPTVLVCAILVDGMTPQGLGNRALAIEALNPTRLAVLTGAEAEELLALPDTRGLAQRRANLERKGAEIGASANGGLGGLGKPC